MPLSAHTTAEFNSGGASTLVAFVSSHPWWNGRPVSITSLSDNMGNTWRVLAGPTMWVGDSFTLLSAIYYVNAPVTGTVHTVTVNLSNPAPLVVHVVAVSGSDIAEPPIHSAITGLRVSRASADVAGTPITVPADTLLLCWAKNESNAKVRALDNYILDRQSTNFLWAESQITHKAGLYTSHFHYDTAIGWQTAIVGLREMAMPVASSRAVATAPRTPVRITLSAFSPKGFPLSWRLISGPTHGSLQGIPPNLTYSPDADYAGPDVFIFKALDGTAESNMASVDITVQQKTFIQRLRDNAMRIGVFSIIWGVAAWVALPWSRRTL